MTRTTNTCSYKLARPNVSLVCGTPLHQLAETNTRMHAWTCTDMYEACSRHFRTKKTNNCFMHETSFNPNCMQLHFSREFIQIRMQKKRIKQFLSKFFFFKFQKYQNLNHYGGAQKLRNPPIACRNFEHIFETFAHN